MPHASSRSVRYAAFALCCTALLSAAPACPFSFPGVGPSRDTGGAIREFYSKPSGFLPQSGEFLYAGIANDQEFTFDVTITSSDALCVNDPGCHDSTAVALRLECTGASNTFPVSLQSAGLTTLKGSFRGTPSQLGCAGAGGQRMPVNWILILSQLENQYLKFDYNTSYVLAN